jgi:hypothetical protein
MEEVKQVAEPASDPLNDIPAHLRQYFVNENSNVVV